MNLLGLTVALAALIVLGGAFTRTSSPSLSTTVTGDTELATRAQPLLPGALDKVSSAVLDGSTVTYANLGANEQTEYEIGSITKTFTGQLLADAIERREVIADTKLGALLDGSAPGVGAMTPQWDNWDIGPGAQQIGYAWQTKLDKGHLVTFKTGLTGGFTARSRSTAKANVR